jgi:hypothetical protein
MVKRRKGNTRKVHIGKGFCENRARARKIDASTGYETCTEQLSPFGGLLALIKFFDLVNFEKIFCSAYHEPSRDPKLGHYSMMMGILMLLFIGFNRIWHFVYIRLDAMLCGFFKITRLPAASTFWRYVDNLGINQANSLLKVMSILRERGPGSYVALSFTGSGSTSIQLLRPFTATSKGRARGTTRRIEARKACGPCFASSKKPESISWAICAKAKRSALKRRRPLSPALKLAFPAVSKRF